MGMKLYLEQFLGARVIEKHFTDNNNRIGPDHAFSMNPSTWEEMVKRTRN